MFHVFCVPFVVKLDFVIQVEGMCMLMYLCSTFCVHFVEKQAVVLFSIISPSLTPPVIVNMTPWITLFTICSFFAREKVPNCKYSNLRVYFYTGHLVEVVTQARIILDETLLSFLPGFLFL